VVEANAVARARRRTTGCEAVVVGVLRGSDAAARASVLLSGADDVLTLPLDPAELVARLQAHLRTVRLWQQLRGELASLRALAAVDPLTELGNRRAFEQELERQLANQQRTGAPLAVLLLDVDQFKRLNDTAGHPAGDAALVARAQGLRQATRGGDFLARIGGDEFAILLPGADEPAASAVLQRIEQQVSTLSLPALPAGSQVRVSAGLAVARPGDGATPASLLATVDYSLRVRRHRLGSAGRCSAPPASPQASERATLADETAAAR